MRLIKRLVAALAVVAATLMAGCEKPAPIPTEEHIPVTYDEIYDCWQMTMWQGKPIAEDTYLYIEFNGDTRTYVMWDNINSMYAVKSTGTFTITEEDGRYTLSGTYDYGKGDWSQEYYVELLNKSNILQWRAKGANEVFDFQRIGDIPELN
jgi:hypothetical protein